MDANCRYTDTAFTAYSTYTANPREELVTIKESDSGVVRIPQVIKRPVKLHCKRIKQHHRVRL